LAVGVAALIAWLRANQQSTPRKFNSEPILLGHDVPELLDKLKNGDAQVRRQVLHTIQTLKAYHGDALSALVTMLEDDEGRDMAVEAFATIGTEAVPTLRDALRDEAAAVREAAAWALGLIGGTSAVPDLMATVNDREARVRLAAVQALGGIADPQAADVLKQATNDPDETVRADAQAALHLMGIRDQSATDPSPVMRS
jgi:HEAT repeat protein